MFSVRGLRVLPVKHSSRRPLPLRALAPSSLSTTPRAMGTHVMIQGDLNNTSVMRNVRTFTPDPAYATKSLAITASEDDPKTRSKYRPFLLPPEIASSDWISKLELSTATKLAEEDLKRTGERLRVLVLYGSLRKRSYSKLLAYEASRILFRLGCDVRVYDPAGLPVKDDVNHGHPKVVELRELSKWSDGHFWVTPEQHGTIVRHFPPLLLLRHSDMVMPRPVSSKTKSTGFPSPPVRCVLPKAAPSPSQKSAAEANLSTP
jgi:hypothetical protein